MNLPNDLQDMPGTIQGISTDNSELVSPTRIWALYQLYRQNQPDHSKAGFLAKLFLGKKPLIDQTAYSPFFDDAASFYLLHIAGFFAASPARPACSYDNLITVLTDADYRKVLVMLRTEPPTAGDELQHIHLKLPADSPQLEKVCQWPGLIDFSRRILMGATALDILSAAKRKQRKQVLDFIESYKFLA
jgi:hypothetical protein